MFFRKKPEPKHTKLHLVYDAVEDLWLVQKLCWNYDGLFDEDRWEKSTLYRGGESEARRIYHLYATGQTRIIMDAKEL
jgi:hypothetical protein